MIDEPEGRAFLQRRVGRLAEDFRDPVVGALVFAAREPSPDDGDDDDATGQADRHNPPGAVSQELPPRFGEDAPKEEPHQDRDQQVGEDENADVAALALHNPPFWPSDPEGSTTGNRCFFARGNSVYSKKLWVQTRHDQRPAPQD